MAVAAMKSGDVKSARRILYEGLLHYPGDLALWLNMAGACRALADLPAALGALEGALGVDPRCFSALLMKASLIERLQGPRPAGIAYGIALTQAPDPALLDPATRRALEHGQAFHAAYLADLRRELIGATAGSRSGSAGEEGWRMNAFIDHLAGARRVFPQQPTTFHYPGLPAIEFYPRELFPWLPNIEAATGAIRDELKAVMADRTLAAEFSPYVAYPPGVPLDQWAELNQSPRWNAFHLIKDGAANPVTLDRCPATMAALAGGPQPRVVRRSPAAMFSVLQPRTRIPPHTGVSNTRLVVHLPLIVPEGCGFRVGNERRAWVEGSAWIFDDTIEHEAWNDSDQARTILIFDIWSPFLSESERALIAQVTEVADAFNGAAPGGAL